MKIVHTSDWHLGRTVWGVSRAPDHQAVLAEIINITSEQQPDLILHTGDLFDQQRPPVHALRLATDALQDLTAIAPVVVICGNHDSAALLHWLHGLMQHGDRIHFVADPDAMRTGTVLRFPVGAGRLHIAALPFITANRVVSAMDDPDGRRDSYANFIANLQQLLLRKLHQDVDETTDVTIFATHQYVSGSIPSRTENPTHTSDFYVTDPEQVPQVNYAAFGHIHKPQILPGSRVIGAYAGSPIQLDFGEVGEDKSIVVAHMEPNGPTRIARIPLRAGRRLEKLSGSLDQLRSQAVAITDEICHITVNTQTHEPNLSRHVKEIFPRATIVDIAEICADRTFDLVTSDTPADGEPDNPAMFRSFLAERGTSDAPAEQVAELFDILLDHVDDEHPPRLPAEDHLAKDPAAFIVPDDEEELVS